jgi:type III secretory pathway component EscU
MGAIGAKAMVMHVSALVKLFILESEIYDDRLCQSLCFTLQHFWRPFDVAAAFRTVHSILASFANAFSALAVIMQTFIS